MIPPRFWIKDTPLVCGTETFQIEENITNMEEFPRATLESLRIMLSHYQIIIRWSWNDVYTFVEKTRLSSTNCRVEILILKLEKANVK